MDRVQYRKILVTHDGSPLASLALPHAIALAKGLGAAVILLRLTQSVGQEIVAIGGMGINAMPYAGEQAVVMVKELRQEASEALEKIRNELMAAGVDDVTVRVNDGDIGYGICSVAREECADIILMSTHGRTGLGRVLLGSATDYVVKHAPCPVLVVRSTEHTQKKGGHNG